ncbi:MAG: NuoM family protein, partial [Parachlamydiaceae bacterium]
ADAYAEAPIEATIILSGLLSKAGIYGILRIAYPLFHDSMLYFSPYLITLAIIGVFYGAFLAWSEVDFKRLLAYSSFSHVNFILAGLFIAIEPSLSGSTLQAFNHGVTITALFIVTYWLEERLGSREIGQVRGLMKFMPRLGWLTLFFVLSSIALPGTNSFIGELLILFGAIKYHFWIAAILVLSVIFSAVYMLRFMQKVYFEEPTFFRDRWIDIGFKQYLIVIPLVFLVLFIGLYPAPFLKQLESVFVTWKAPLV